MPSPSRWLAAAHLIVLSLAGPQLARAGSFELRVALEPGAAILRDRERVELGALGGASASVSYDRFGLCAHVDTKRLLTREPTLAATTYGAGFRFALDVSEITPFFEFGSAHITLNEGGEPYYGPRWDSYLALGFDIVVDRQLLWGAVVRYHEALGTGLFDDPAYATINLRLGSVIGGPLRDQPRGH